MPNRFAATFFITTSLALPASAGRLFMVPQGTDPVEADATFGSNFPVTVQPGQTITFEVYIQDHQEAFSGLEVAFACEGDTGFESASPIHYVADSIQVDSVRPDYIFTGLANFPAADSGQCVRELPCDGFSCPGNSQCEALYSLENDFVCTIAPPRAAAVLFLEDPISIPGESKYFAQISYDVPENAVGTSIIGPVCCRDDADCDGVADEGCQRINPNNPNRLVLTSIDNGEFLPIDGIELTVDAPLQLADTTTPFSGYIDPLAELDTSGTRTGITSAQMRFSESIFGSPTGDPVTIENFTISSTGGITPGITSIDITDAPFPVVTFDFDGPIPLQHWTTIVAYIYDANGDPILNEGSLGENGDEPDRLDMAALPGDIDQNGIVEPMDIFRFRKLVNSENTPSVGTIEQFADLDRNGAVEPLDLFRFRQILVGVGLSSQPWSGQSLKETRP